MWIYWNNGVFFSLKTATSVYHTPTPLNKFPVNVVNTQMHTYTHPHLPNANTFNLIIFNSSWLPRAVGYLTEPTLHMCSQVTCYQSHAGRNYNTFFSPFVTLFRLLEPGIGILISLLALMLTIVLQLVFFFFFFLTYALGEIYIANSDLLVKMPDCTSGWLKTSDAGCVQKHWWQDCACRRQLPRSASARFKDETFNRTRPTFCFLDFICSKQKGLINTSITSRS